MKVTVQIMINIGQNLATPGME